MINCSISPKYAPNLTRSVNFTVHDGSGLVSRLSMGAKLVLSVFSP